MITAEMPGYARLQRELADASGSGALRVLELGTGTGETARRLARGAPVRVPRGHRRERARCSTWRAMRFRPGASSSGVGSIEDELPEGPFDLVASALRVHHLTGPRRPSCSSTSATRCGPGGRFVLADVVVPEDPADATTPLTPGFDRPSPLADQLHWLEDAGFDAQVRWASGDLAVVVAHAPS